MHITKVSSGFDLKARAPPASTLCRTLRFLVYLYVHVILLGPGTNSGSALYGIPIGTVKICLVSYQDRPRVDGLV
jgi:hypothetical protein